MRIIFSPHALQRLAEREIKREVALNALENPDKIEVSRQNRRRLLFKKVYFNQTLRRDHLLMLICEEKDEEIEVVTIIDTSKISKYL